MLKIWSAAKGLLKGGLKPVPGSGILKVIGEIKNIKALKGNAKVELVCKIGGYLIVALLIWLIAAEKISEVLAIQIMELIGFGG